MGTHTLIGQRARKPAPPTLADLVTPHLSPEDFDRAVAAGEAETFTFPDVLSGRVHVATYSTPFVAVALAAWRAKKQMLPLDIARDLPPHLVIVAHPIVGNSELLVSPTSIVITPQEGSYEEKRRSAVQPTRVETTEGEYKNLAGATLNGAVLSAEFPLTLLNPDNQVWVGYDSRTSPSRPALFVLPKQ